MPKVSSHHKLMRRFSDPASFQRTEVDMSVDEAFSMTSSSTSIDENNIDLVNLQAQSDDITDDNQLRRPMNAFLLFCKRHRGIVKQKHPWLDNRSCTKMLADMWAVLDPDEKNRYLQLARECKAAFMKAHPDYKWCGTSRHKSSPGACTGGSRKLFPMQDVSKINLSMIAKEGITVGKLADPESMGGLSMLLLAGQHTMVKPESSSGNVKSEVEEDEPVSPTSTLFQLAEMCSDRLPLSVMMKQKEKQKKKEMEEAESKKMKNTKSEQSDDDSNLHGSARRRRRKEDKEIESKISLDKKDHITNKDSSDCSHSRDEESPKKASKTKSKGKKKKKSKNKNKDVEKSESMNKKNLIEGHGENGDDEENRQSEELEIQDLDNDDSKVESDADRVSEDESGIPRRRQSSRSCKGRLYREFVLEGMLETLQRQERPFNCKKTWRHENTTFTDEEDMIFEQEVEKWKKTSKKRRRRTVSGSGSTNIDYGDINIEAKLAALPQLSMDQFRPKTKAQRSKKSAKMYKNAMFFTKDSKHRAKSKENAVKKQRKSEPEITGSRKRKAKKSSIVHLVPRSEDADNEDACHCSNDGMSDAEAGHDEETAEINKSYHRFSLTDLAEVASRESKPCSSNIVKVNVHKSTTSAAISSASIHRPPLMVP